MKEVDPINSERSLEIVAGYVLLVGVVVCVVCELAGVVLYSLSTGNLNIDLAVPRLFVQGRNFYSLLFGLSQSDPNRSSAVFFMTLGMCVLILTPYLLTLIALFFFAWKRNLKYLLITGFVAAAITISLAIH